MQVSTIGAGASGFFTVNFESFAQTLSESLITESYDLGGVTVHRGMRYDEPIWLVGNPGASEYGYPIWVEEAGCSASGFRVVDFNTFAEVLEQTEVTDSWDHLGGGVAVYFGMRNGETVWLMDNPMGSLYGVWVEENDQLPN